MVEDRQVKPVLPEPSGLQTEFQNHLADSAKSVAEGMHSHGYAARGVQKMPLVRVGVELPLSDAGGLKPIPEWHEISRYTKLEAGDEVVVGRPGHDSNSFTVTYDMKALSSDHVASIPALDKFPEVHIYRAD
jgi:hypothetical protein